MADNSAQNILREYLIALGFRVDQTGNRTVTNILGTLDKKGLKLGKTLVGVGATVVGLTTLFARNMEKLYYSSRYADLSAGNLQALEYGARGVGLGAGAMTSAITGMTAAMRSNPGLKGFMEAFTGKTTDRDKGQVMLDFIEKLKTLPFYKAERIANMFGLDAQTLFNLEEGLTKLKALKEQRQEMAREMGFDADQASKMGVEYMTLWRQVTERASVFAGVLGHAALPYVQTLVGATNELLIDWSHIVQDIEKLGSEQFWQKLREGITGHTEKGGGVTLKPEAADRAGNPEASYQHSRWEGLGIPRLMEDYRRWKAMRDGKYIPRKANEAAVDATTDNSDFNKHPEMSEAERVRRTREALAKKHVDEALAAAGSPSVIPAAPSAGDQDAGDTTSPGVDVPGSRFDPEDFLRDLEKQYHLPPGLLDRVWKRESQRGDPRFMRSPAGAKGHFGFMDKTAAAYGVKDPDDFMDSAKGAAKMWEDLLKAHHGNVREAAAAYNWGEGNLQKRGLGAAPKETRDYEDAIAGGDGGSKVSIQANPTINVYGVKDPAEAARTVLEEQKGVNANIVRNFSPKVR